MNAAPGQGEGRNAAGGTESLEGRSFGMGEAPREPESRVPYLRCLRERERFVAVGWKLIQGRG